ncbi:flagellar hook-length control protein FliK [Piscinibacter sakaiensis]|uniref:flagellar hook-length control protein FliK n=1 Tax=Piscinibacter sakaiensis TaxID=1547922 RepID=UPI00372BE61B
MSDAGTAEVQLPTPVHAPDFADALGARVSVLAGDGVQEAELHLNPGDMGPIAVKITLDGAQAQVDFGVDNARTRALLEDSLPQLASALHQAGLTLSGGGVSQHPRGQGGGTSGDASGSGGAPGDARGRWPPEAGFRAAYRRFRGRPRSQNPSQCADGRPPSGGPAAPGPKEHRWPPPPLTQAPPRPPARARRS